METKNENAAAPKSEPSRKSVVDALFDTLTVQTARGLVVAKEALETAARWLDGQAKVVGHLASKLSPTATASPSTESAST